MKDVYVSLKAQVYQITNHLQAVLGHLEMDECDKALGATKLAVDSLHMLAEGLGTQQALEAIKAAGLLDTAAIAAKDLLDEAAVTAETLRTKKMYQEST